MTHDPEMAAATYLAHEIPPDELERFEMHLLECEACWREVQTARPGAAAAENARELAPSHLRDRIRRTAGDEPPTPGVRKPRWKMIGAAAAAVVVLAVGAGAVVAVRQAGDPSVIAAAVSGFDARRLPGAGTAQLPAPDLSALRLVEVGAGSGKLAGMTVDAYAYRDDAGRELMLYIGSETFPMPRTAQPLDGERGPWIATVNGVAVLCARHPHELLIVGADDALVRAAAAKLNVI